MEKRQRLEQDSHLNEMISDIKQMNRSMMKDTQKSVAELEKKVVNSLEKKISEGNKDQKN